MIAHSHDIRVYYEDTDAGGVVYYANYLRFAERARTEALRAAGLPHAMMVAEHGVMFMVRRAELEYLRPARLDDVVTIRSEPLSVTAATVTLRQSFSVAETSVAEARILLACVKVATGFPARIPLAWRTAMAA